MKTLVFPGALSGEINAVPSKSDAHRLFICAAFAESDTFIELGSVNDDITATLACLKELGAEIRCENGGYHISPVKEKRDFACLDCGESGSTLRFLLPVALCAAEKVRFTGHGRLPERPNGALIEQMKKHGVVFSSEKLPFEISGTLSGGEFELPGNVSSQFISGLLLAAAAMKKNCTVKLSSPLASSEYVDMTISAMKRFSAAAEKKDGHFTVCTPKGYVSPKNVRVEGDWSSAAFFLAAAAINGDVTVSGLDNLSVQGDKAIADILRRMGAEVFYSENAVRVKAAPMNGIEIDVENVPDLFPVLAVTAAFSEGKTVFTNISRLHFKESDRVKSTLEMLRALGAKCEVYENTFIVYRSVLKGSRVEGVNDHRIVMSAAVAALKAEGEVIISESEAVNKSYPSFFDDLIKLGGKCNVI